MTDEMTNENIVNESSHNTEPNTQLMRGPVIDTSVLKGINSLEDAVNFANAQWGDIAAADKEIGDGFALLDNKDHLVDVPCLFLTWSFNHGDFSDFVSARIVAQTQTGVAKYIVNDGSTGICKQLMDYTDETGRMGGLLAKHGLRRSDYEYEDNITGEKKPATTFYIDTSA